MSYKPKRLGKIKIPKIGLGTWRLRNSIKSEAALYKALELGYRYFLIFIGNIYSKLVLIKI